MCLQFCSMGTLKNRVRIGLGGGGGSQGFEDKLATFKTLSRQMNNYNAVPVR